MTITVSCPSCNTFFPVDPAKIPEGGVRAQCSACPEIFEVDKPEATGVESTFAGSATTFDEPAAAIALDEADVPPEVQSSFGADAEVVADIAEETADEFGEREITFDSITTEADEAFPVSTEPEAEAATNDFGAIEIEVPVVEEEAPPEAAAPAAPIQFGRRSPEDKARSLARSLVSDLIAYNPAKHTEALASGTLVQVFSEEIEKSWKEYREQVDPDVMTQGTFFNDALNELLANGEVVFSLEG